MASSSLPASAHLSCAASSRARRRWFWIDSFKWPSSAGGVTPRRSRCDNWRNSAHSSALHQAAQITQPLLIGVSIDQGISDCQDDLFQLRHARIRRLDVEGSTYRNVFPTEDRIHDSLGRDLPQERPVEPKPVENAMLISLTRVGGLHHRYTWRQAA